MITKKNDLIKNNYQIVHYVLFVIVMKSLKQF